MIRSTLNEIWQQVQLQCRTSAQMFVPLHHTYDTQMNNSTYSFLEIFAHKTVLFDLISLFGDPPACRLFLVPAYSKLSPSPPQLSANEFYLQAMELVSNQEYSSQVPLARVPSVVEVDNLPGYLTHVYIGLSIDPNGPSTPYMFLADDDNEPVFLTFPALLSPNTRMIQSKVQEFFNQSASVQLPCGTTKQMFVQWNNLMETALRPLYLASNMPTFQIQFQNDKNERTTYTTQQTLIATESSHLQLQLVPQQQVAALVSEQGVSNPAVVPDFQSMMDFYFVSVPVSNFLSSYMMQGSTPGYNNPPRKITYGVHNNNDLYSYAVADPGWSSYPVLKQLVDTNGVVFQLAQLYLTLEQWMQEPTSNQLWLTNGNNWSSNTIHVVTTATTLTFPCWQDTLALLRGIRMSLYLYTPAWNVAGPWTFSNDLPVLLDQCSIFLHCSLAKAVVTQLLWNNVTFRSAYISEIVDNTMVLFPDVDGTFELQWNGTFPPASTRTLQYQFQTNHGWNVDFDMKEVDAVQIPFFSQEQLLDKIQVQGALLSPDTLVTFEEPFAYDIVVRMFENQDVEYYRRLLQPRVEVVDDMEEFHVTLVSDDTYTIVMNQQHVLQLNTSVTTTSYSTTVPCLLFRATRADDELFPLRTYNPTTQRIETMFTKHIFWRWSPEVDLDALDGVAGVEHSSLLSIQTKDTFTPWDFRPVETDFKSALSIRIEQVLPEVQLLDLVLTYANQDQQFVTQYVSDDVEVHDLNLWSNDSPLVHVRVVLGTSPNYAVWDIPIAKLDKTPTLNMRTRKALFQDSEQWSLAKIAEHVVWTETELFSIAQVQTRYNASNLRFLGREKLQLLLPSELERMFSRQFEILAVYKNIQPRSKLEDRYKTYELRPEQFNRHMSEITCSLARFERFLLDRIQIIPYDGDLPLVNRVELEFYFSEMASFSLPLPTEESKEEEEWTLVNVSQLNSSLLVVDTSIPLCFENESKETCVVELTVTSSGLVVASRPMVNLFWELQSERDHSYDLVIVYQALEFRLLVFKLPLFDADHRLLGVVFQDWLVLSSSPNLSQSSFTLQSKPYSGNFEFVSKMSEFISIFQCRPL